jgi:hypothetical protein
MSKNDAAKEVYKGGLLGAIGSWNTENDDSGNSGSPSHSKKTEDKELSR